MKHVDEYRDPVRINALASELADITTQPWSIMEVCGGQTHAIMKYGLEQFLPETITLLHGPGCPVCVTPELKIDQAIMLSHLEDHIVCTFGDMLRVPGSQGSLAQAKARGGDVRVVYSPLDALELAQAEPDRMIVFFAIGFETTAPMTAWSVYQAKHSNLGNYSLLVTHVRVPPALDVMLRQPGAQIDAFLGAGHVCTVMGLEEYGPICERYRVPVVATGFEPADILEGVLMCVRQLEGERACVENQYRRAVKQEGNEKARAMLSEVFEIADQSWRGIGTIAQSGLRLRSDYAQHDASLRFSDNIQHTTECKSAGVCMSGEVLCGRVKPSACPAFGTSCTPAHPLGAPMVSSEGACAAYFRYAQRNL